MNPSSDQPLHRFDQAHQIDQICDEFERAWKEQQHPEIESFLSRVPAEQQVALFGELLPLELELRGAVGAMDRHDYQLRFPEQAEVVEDAFSRFSPTEATPDLQSLADTMVPVRENDSPQSLVAELESLATVEFYNSGDCLIRQGDAADFLLVIQDGRVRVTVDRDLDSSRTIDHSGPGEMLGEMALITNQPRTANVIAEGPVVAAKLPAERFHQLVRDQPKYSRVLTDLIARRLGGHQHDALTDKQLDRYRIRRRLGRGGMAVVYEAEDLSTGETTALKMMSHALIYDQIAHERFQLEADLIERFSHPNIVGMHRRFDAFHTCFIAMEYCQGTSLDEHLQGHGGMDPEEFTAAFCQLASALAYAHQQGIVHRDLKPANIMRLPNGTLKLMDFGLAEPLLDSPIPSRGLVGTPRYMAPEQRRGNPIDERADLFALGAVAYEMLSGTPLFDAGQTKEIFRSFGNWIPPDFESFAVSHTTATELRRLLEVDVEKRKVDLSKWVG